MKVVEIFDSIDGEGIRTGKTATFIRLAGCNLRCSYCDTLYALFGESEDCSYTEMSVEEIVSRVNPVFKRVTLTGGEPLIHKDVKKLIDTLCERGIEVNIETNGAVDIRPFKNGSDKLFFTVDYKLLSSGEEDKMLWENFISLDKRDVIKFVIGSDEDVIKMKEVITKIKACDAVVPNLFAGTVFKDYAPSRLVEEILNDEILADVCCQLQIHKFIWDPDERGV